MAELQKGDDRALATLVRRYADPLMGYLARMNLFHVQADDVFQETFLRVHTKSASFRTDRRFKPWLYAIATHAALDALRRARRAPPTLSLDADADGDRPLHERLPDAAPDPAEAAALGDQRAQVREALEALPARQRATVVLTYFEGLTYNEAAQTLGCTVGSVKKQMSRALQRLARLLPESRPTAPGGGAP